MSARSAAGVLSVGLVAGLAASFVMLVSDEPIGRTTYADSLRQPVSRPAIPAVPSDRPPAPPPAPREITVAVAGDVLLHKSLWSQAQQDADGDDYDFRPLLAGVSEVISDADLAICHLETPLAPARGPYSSYPVFSVPSQIVPALAWAGYDACTTASNHAIDRGESGVGRTLDMLDGAGLAHAGSARSEAEANRTTIVDVADVRIAVLSSTYGLNGLHPQRGKEWIVNLIDPIAILADARQARRLGADLVLVALHWGVEYRHAPTQEQREIARMLLASPDVDLVYGHHAHVVQPFERIGGKWVAYGLGNQVADQAGLDPATREGVIARFTFTETVSGRWVTTVAQYAPTYITRSSPLRVLDVGLAMTDPETSNAARRTFGQIWRSVTADVTALGADRDGLQPVEH